MVSMYYLLPLYVMIVTSLKGMPEIRMGNIFAPPLEVTYQPWVKAWSEACTGINCDGLSRGFWNSVQILVPSCVLLVLVHSVFGMPILTLLFRNYFSSMPEELFKAARVDGAGFWRIFLQIMLPMALPIFVVAIILQVTGIWNDFLFGVIYTKPATYPMTVQLNNIVNSVQGVKEYNVNMAATILTAAVPLVIYFVSGKLFVRGIAAGAVKG